MNEAIEFLSLLDPKHPSQLPPPPSQPSTAKQRLSSYTRIRQASLTTKRTSRYPYAKPLNFNEQRYKHYPQWLTHKDGFFDFMYQHYESKLMSIPVICQKKEKASDQKYFIGMYLGQIEVFRDLPHVALDLIVTRLECKTYKAGQVIHTGEGVPQFMGVIFVGSILEREAKKNRIYGRQEVVMRNAFYQKEHTAVLTAKEETVLLVLPSNSYPALKQTLRSEFQTKEADDLVDLLKSTFFSELHIKQKRARSMYKDFEMLFFLKGDTIEDAGHQVSKFYLIVRGQVEEENHVYVRQHNKWPLPNRKWEVRAVYNSHHKARKLGSHQFFGDEEIITNSNFRSKYIATRPTILLALSVSSFLSHLTNQDVKRLKKYRSEHMDINYGQLQKTVRDRARSMSHQRSIIKKAINTSLAHKQTFTPHRMTLIDNFQKTMMRKTFFAQGK